MVSAYFKCLKLHDIQAFAYKSTQGVEGGYEDFCVRTLVFWLMVLMITEFACREGSIKKHCGWCVPSMLIDTHRLAIQISAPFDVVWIFGFDTNDFRIFWFKRNNKKGREDLNWKAGQYLAVATRKTEGDNPVGSAFGANPNQERDMILPLRRCEHNLVLGANAQRFS